MIGAKGIDDLLAAGGSPRLRQRYRKPAELSLRKRIVELPERTPPRGGSNLVSARTRVAQEISRFVRRSKPGDALLVSSDPGTGKSTAVAEAIGREQSNARVLVGTQRLAREQAIAYGYALIEGRADHNCLRYEVVEALQDAGHPVERLACGTAASPLCPFRTGCEYYRQFQSPGARIGSAEQLYNPNFLRGGNLVVLDDPDLMRSLFDRVTISLDSIARSLARLGKRPQARAVLEVLGHAALSADRVTRQGADFWDHLVAEGHLRGVDFPKLVEALPKKGTLPTPKASDGPLDPAGVAAVPSAHIGKILAALQEELSLFLTGRDFNSRMRFRDGGIDVASVRSHARGKDGPLVADMAVLMLDATPVESLLANVFRHHVRLPDVEAPVMLPPNVRVVQYADSSNGHTVMASGVRMDRIAAEIAAERQAHPTTSRGEAVISFKTSRAAFERLGFDGDRILSYGSVRGTNALDSVERLHVVGRTMPPAEELHFLAQVLHHDEAWVSPEMEVRIVPFAGTRFAGEVPDFCDPRLSALLHAAREGEIIQVLHRARLTTVESQSAFGGHQSRPFVSVVLHTNQPVPGLRIDEFHQTTTETVTLNERRSAEAEDKVRAAVSELELAGALASVEVVRRRAGVNWRTAKKVMDRLDVARTVLGATMNPEREEELGNTLYTLKEDLSNGLQRVPMSGTEDANR